MASRHKPNFNLEQILAVAAADPPFHAALLAERIVAVERLGFELTETEKSVLESVSDDVLEMMITKVQERAVPGAPSTMVRTGIRPGEQSQARGIRPDRPTEHEKVKGIRPGHIALAAAAAAVIAGAAASTLLVTGSRPDPPPAASQVDTRAEDEAGDGGPPRDAEIDSVARKEPKDR